MRFSLKTWSFGLAVASFAAAGVASAQSLVGVNAQLVHTLDSASAKAGEAVAVKLDSTIRTADGMKLPKGTELVGTVAEVQASQNGGPAVLTLILNKAELKNGKQIPVKATVVGAYPASQGDSSGDTDQVMAEPPAQIAPDATIDQEPGALKKIALNASVKSSDSVTFRRANGNFKLESGTYFQVGLAPLSGAAATSAAE